jgi:putative PIN family toxin of toxin-antitoxin system
MNYRIVVDTNVVVSAVLNPKGTPSAILDAVVDGDILLILSDAILEEVRNVFSYRKIEKLLEKRGITQQEIDTLLETLIDISIFVPGELELNIVENDPADNKFMACAMEGNADFLVSGDHHLTELGAYQSVQVVTPVQFLEIIDQK